MITGFSLILASHRRCAARVSGPARPIFVATRDDGNGQIAEATGNPPDGVEVVSWCVMIGIGQVVTIKLPAVKLRKVNRVIEHTAWGAFATEFNATYDFRPVWEQNRAKG